MEIQKSKMSIVNSVFLYINLIILIGLTIYNLIKKGPLLRFYGSMDKPLPMITLLMLTRSHFIFIVFSIIFIVKEAIKQKGITYAINMLGLIMVLGLLVLYCFALILPRYQM